MLWMARLDDHLAAALGATRAAGDLGDQLCQTLRSAKVATEQALVRIEDADQADIRKVVALGQHLGAEQNMPLAASRLVQQASHGTLATGAVPVDAEHT